MRGFKGRPGRDDRLVATEIAGLVGQSIRESEKTRLERKREEGGGGGRKTEDASERAAGTILFAGR